jgi:hypothetical protein
MSGLSLASVGRSTSLNAPATTREPLAAEAHDTLDEVVLEGGTCQRTNLRKIEHPLDLIDENR